METDEIKIKLYDKRERCTTTMYVEKLANNKFRMIGNSVFNCRLTIGTEFETRINKNGEHEIVKITKESDYITRRLMLTAQFKESEYLLLGDEIAKQGGHWEVYFGSVAIVNLPKDCQLNIDEIFEIFGFNPTEITE